MDKQHGVRASLVAVLAILAVLMVPAAAQAHHATSTAKCEVIGTQPTVTLKVTFVSFSSTKSITGTITFDGSHAKTVGPGDIRWSGTTGTLTYTRSTSGGAHTVNGDFTWPGKREGDNGMAHHTVTCHKGISIVKDGPATAYVGSQATFTYAVKNTGNVTLSTPVVTDDKCAPVAKVPEPNTNTFDPGDTFRYTCTTTITAAMGDQLVNVGTACADWINPNGPDQKVCDDDDHTTKIPKPAIALEKTGAATAAAGATFTYSFKATNTGNVTLANVALTDAKCQSTLTRAEPNLADAAFDPGDVWSFTCTVTAPAGPAQVDNVAKVCGGYDDADVEPMTVCAADPHTFTVPPPAVPPSVTPDTTPPSVTPDGGALPGSVVSGVARLRGPSGCVRQAFRARVSGRSIASVAFSVDGKVVKRFTGRRSVYSIKVRPGRYGFGRHRIVALVRFSAASGTKARRLPLTFRRCAQGAVAPRFTG